MTGSIRPLGSSYFLCLAASLLLYPAALSQAPPQAPPSAAAAALPAAQQAVRVSWAAPASGPPPQGYVVRASPLAFSDALFPALDPSWVWDAPLCPANGGASVGVCGYSVGRSANFTSIGIAQGVGIGGQTAQVGNSMRSTAPMLLRPEALDSAVSWSAQVTINHFIGNGNGKVYNLVACLVVLDADTGGAWLTYGPTTWEGLFSVYSEAKSNDANAFGGVGLVESGPGAGQGTYRIDWNAKLRRFEAYSKLNEADTTWWGPAYWSTQQVNTNVAATWGMRQPSRFRIGLGMRSWANSTIFAANGGRLYASFKNFAFTTAPDPGAKSYFHSTLGGELSLALSPPRFLPYTFAVASRGANGTLSPFTLAAVNGATASGLAVLPFRGVLADATMAKLNATASQNGYWWDFSAERPQTRSVNFVRDRSFHRSNYLVQDTAAYGNCLAPPEAGARFAILTPHPPHPHPTHMSGQPLGCVFFVAGTSQLWMVADWVIARLSSSTRTPSSRRSPFSATRRPRAAAAT